MRTLIWSGAAAALTAVTFTLLAFDYARRHPESRLGRCAVQASRVAARCSPVGLLSRWLCQRAESAARAGKPVTVSVRETSRADRPSPPAAASGPVPEVIDLTEYRVQIQQEIEGCQPEECQSPMLLSPPVQAEIGSGLTSVLVSPSVLGAEEVEPMPACCDEEPESPEKLPTDQTVDDAELIEILRSLLHDAAGQPVGEAATDPEEVAADAPEEMDDGMAPDMQEDPDYHQHYPSCPHMNSRYCRYTGKCYPDEPPPTTEQPQADRPAAAPAEDGAEQEEMHPEVDTMEFRPEEDARQGEFEPQPF
jgi:hypothetical protein